MLLLISPIMPWIMRTVMAMPSTDEAASRAPASTAVRFVAGSLASGNALMRIESA